MEPASRENAHLTELRRLWRERALLVSCGSALAWDEETSMPPAGAAHRAEQQALLAGLVHDRTLDPRLGELLASLEGAAGAGAPDPLGAADLREARRAVDQARRTPRALVEELARVTTLSQAAWADARDRSDWNVFAPWLDRVLALKREEASAIAGGGPLYDVLLDEWEPGLTLAALRPLARQVSEGVSAVLASVPRPSDDARARDLRARNIRLAAPAPAARQKAFFEETATAFGFSHESGRVDRATHPSTICIGPGDVRLTLRWNEEDFTQAFLCGLHELGHWLYDAALEPGRWGMPAGDAISLGLHESQARLLENFVGRSPAFWTWAWPRARESLGLSGLTRDDLVAALHAVAPSPVRVGADEVTYDLHVVVRIELEVALLEGTLDAAGVPAAWNEAYASLVGIVPRDPVEGCLQDGHWSAAMFGYFPTYLVGNCVAAQLVEAARRELGDQDAAWARGDFAPLVGWLRERVHRHGGRERLFERVREATGRDLDARAFLEHLRARYVR